MKELDIKSSFAKYNCLYIFRSFNTVEALQKAKDNVEKHYAVVGVLEDFNKTLEVFECLTH